MDILDIVNSYINNKQELTTESLDVDMIVSKLNNKEKLEEITSKLNVSKEFLIEKLLKSGYMFNTFHEKWVKEGFALPFGTLLEIVSSMFIQNVDLNTLSLKYLVPEKIIIQELENRKFRKRWTFIENDGQSILSEKMKFILYQLNSLHRDIKEVAEKEGLAVFDIEQEFKKANYREIWMLEKTVVPPYGISALSSQKVIYDINTGEPNVLIDNEKKLFTMNQVKYTLGINANLIYNKFYHDFRKNVHFINASEYFGKDLQLFKALPHLKYLNNKLILFTERGLHLFATYTNTTSLSHKKIQEIEKILLLEKQNVELKSNQYLKNHNNTIPQKSKDEKIEYQDNSAIDSKEVNPEIIVNKLNMNIGLSNIAKEYEVQLTQVNKILRDAGYRFDAFFNIWTNKSEDQLIRESIDDLNKGPTLYDYAYKFMKAKNQRLHFADRLRRKIESRGYYFEQKSKKWILKDGSTNVVNKVKPDTNHYKTDEMKVNEPDATSKGQSSDPLNEIVKILRQGGTLKTVEDQTGIKSQEIRIMLKSEGYKYDGFFKTWINEERDSLLKKIAADITDKKVTIDEIAKSYNITKDELEEKLKSLGYIPSGQENQLEEKIDSPRLTNSEPIDKIDEKNYSNLNLTFSDEELLLLKELIEQKKEKQLNKEKKAVKIYLNEQLFEELEDYSEKNSISKSNLIEKALENYLWK